MYLELADGRTIVATDGADLIEPATDGQMLRGRWNRWALVGGKPGEWVDVGLSSEVVWRIEKQTLIREETLTSRQPLNVRRWRLAVPTTYAVVETKLNNNTRLDRFSSNDGSLEVQMLDATFPIESTVFATGDSALGRGVRGAIPLHLVFESNNLALQSDRPLKFRLAIAVNASGVIRGNNEDH